MTDRPDAIPDGPKKVCSEEGCGGKVKGRGFCGKHYQRAYLAGSAMPPSKRDLKVSFFERALQCNTDECIEWPFGKRGAGYGQTYLTGKSDGAHVYICRIAHGEKPSVKDQVAHSCGNRLCVNPRHLRWATRAENEADKIKHGTNNNGMRNVRAKLADDAVMEIRNRRGVETQKELAKRFGVSVSAICDIQVGRSWAHIK